MLWTETDDELLKQLILEGLSARAIGERLGRSRNAVCGRVDRLKKQMGLVIKRPDPEPKVERTRTPQKKKTKLDFSATSLWQGIYALGPNDCRYPLGNEFCCKPTGLGCSYCGEHFKIVYYVKGQTR